MSTDISQHHIRLIAEKEMKILITSAVSKNNGLVLL
jgi:hypothetical protein